MNEDRIGAYQRWERSGHKGSVVWLTGLSGSGKSTLSRAVERELFARDYLVYVLDGDRLRKGLNADLGFSPAERSENIRRTAEVARLLAMSGQVTVAALISPYRKDRDMARAIAVGSGIDFFEVFVDAPVTVCESRDPKGLYRRARAGEIADFTGVDAPYEYPEEPEIHLRTAELSIKECTMLVLDHLLVRLQIGQAASLGGEPKAALSAVG